jgi:hypothetical protein
MIVARWESEVESGQIEEAEALLKRLRAQVAAWRPIRVYRADGDGSPKVAIEVEFDSESQYKWMYSDWRTSPEGAQMMRRLEEMGSTSFQPEVWRKTG